MTSSALGLSALLALWTGIGLLSVSGGMVLARTTSIEFALCVVGLGFVGVALVLVALLLPRRSAPPPATRPAPDLTAAFLSGLDMGQQTGRATSRRGREAA
ncbi:hypothetical protein [Pseudooceanicola sp.]|uniref:hypothetical protein n=1 Tax=Pseudooceanicola sp. TaxID=1914328 RepID=UPI0035C6DE18